jgi:AsmA protein
MRAVKIAGAAVAAVILLLALGLAVGLPSGFLNSAIRDRVERETGWRLTVAGSTRISMWPRLNVSLNDVALQDPRDRDGSSRLTVDHLQADMSVRSIWSGHPKVTELVLGGPVLHLPLLRERVQPTASAARRAAQGAEDEVSIDRITISNGAIAFSNARDHVESRIDGIAGLATVDADRKIKFDGIARSGDHPLKFNIRAAVPTPTLERQNIPFELTFEAPDLLRGPLTAKAEARLNGSVVMINGLSGTLDDGAFTGWASVDLASKPLVKLDLDFQRLDVPWPKAASDSGKAGWSDAPINLAGLNYVDAQVRISAADVEIGNAHFAPAAMEATLAGGVLKTSVSNLGTYGGQASGELIVDATNGTPSYAMHCDLIGVRALPLLSGLADFDKIDGKMQAKIAARSAGASQHAIMANTSGTAFVIFQDGAIRGLNVAQMIRQLTASPLSGWQEGKEQATDLTQLSASFRIDRGQATTTDLNLIGPLVKLTGAGTIDLGTRMIGFRVEPQLVLTTEGQGRTTDPVGFGIPVMISGPWNEPRIYPEVQGILDNPDAAYAKLREMGKGLFGPNSGLGGILDSLGGLAGNQGGTAAPGAGAGNGSDPLAGLGQTLGTLIQQGLGGAGSTPGTAGRGRGIPAPQADTPPPPPPQSEPHSEAIPSPQESQPMNDVLRQLFNR